MNFGPRRSALGEYDDLASRGGRASRTTDVCADTGFPLEVAGQSFRAPDRGGYVAAVSDYDFDFPIEVTEVGDRAYRAVNAWPSPESLAAQVEAALRAAAEAEQDLDKKTRLQAILPSVGSAETSSLPS